MAWSFYGSQDNTIDLLKAIGNHENVTAYALCYVKSDRDLKSELFSLGGDDQTTVWFNGKLVNQNSMGRRLVVDQDSFPVEIKRGKNRLLIKVTQRRDSWEFVGRFQLGASGQLFALDGTTPHSNVVVQALKDNHFVHLQEDITHIKENVSEVNYRLTSVEETIALIKAQGWKIAAIVIFGIFGMDIGMEQL